MCRLCRDLLWWKHHSGVDAIFPFFYGCVTSQDKQFRSYLQLGPDPRQYLLVRICLCHIQRLKLKLKQLTKNSFDFGRTIVV